MQQIKEIEEMSYKELRAEVRRISDELTKFKRLYEDAIEHLTLSNFDGKFVKEYKGLKTEITTAAGIVKSRVSKVDLEKALEQYTSVSQTYEAIESVASKAVDLNDATKIFYELDGEINPENDFTNENLIYAATVTDTGNRHGKVLSVTYYYYNDTVKKWQTLSGNTIYTICKQTNEGFEFLGNVVISGDLITEGKITGIVIQSYDESDNVIRMTDGYLYLIPNGASKASLKIGMNTDGEYAYPFMIFGAGSGTGSVSVAGAPSVAGAMTFYKSENGFELRFKPTTGGKEQGIWFYDYGKGIEPHIGFGNSTLDFQGATVNGLKITFG